MGLYVGHIPLCRVNMWTPLTKKGLSRLLALSLTFLLFSYLTVQVSEFYSPNASCVNANGGGHQGSDTS